MKRSKFSLTSAGVALSGLAAGLAVAALSLASAVQVNLVSNGDFSQGMTGWDDWFPSLSNIYVTNDEHLFIQAKTAKAGWHFHSVSRCIENVPAASEYTMSSDVLFPQNQGRNGQVHVRVQSYLQPTCSGPAIHSDPQVLPASGWQSVAYKINAPVGTQAFRISLAVETWEAQPGQDPNVALWAEFDNVAITTDVAPPEPTATSTPTPTEDPTVAPPEEPTKEPTVEPTEVPTVVVTPVVTPDVPEPVLPDPTPPAVDPDVPQGPFDVPIPGPLGGQPTATPTPSPTPTPTASPTSTPTNPPKAETPTSQPQHPATPVTETPQAATPAATPASEPVAPVIVAAQTPLPPSAGTGIASQAEGPTFPLLAAALAALAGALTAAGAAIRTR